MISTAPHPFINDSRNNLIENFPILQPMNEHVEIEFALEHIALLKVMADVETVITTLLNAANDYISQPLDLPELQSRIRSVLNNRRNISTQFTQPSGVSPLEISMDSADSRFLQKAVSIVEFYLKDSNLGTEFLAKEMAVSQTQLYRKLQACTGSGPNEFIRHMRLARVVDLMKCKAGNVSEIAFQAGFNNLSYFAKVFKVKFGVTPAEFLKKQAE